MHDLQQYSARLIRAFVGGLPAGRWSASDVLDDDGMGSGPITINVGIERKGRRLIVDFSGTDAQVRGPVNANLAVTTSAVFYVIACLAGRDVPPNRGMMDRNNFV